MTAGKSWKTSLVLVTCLLTLLFLPACEGTGTPPVRPETLSAVQSPELILPADVTPPVITIRQELEEQRDMLRALVDAERWRGKDVSQAERWLNEADDALQSDDLALAREKLRQAGDALGVELP